MDVDHTITLLKPIEHGGQTIKTIDFREPNGGDIERMQESKGSDLVKSYKLMADLAEIEPEVIRKLSVRDIGQINKWLEPILDPKDPLAR